MDALFDALGMQPAALLIAVGTFLLLWWILAKTLFGPIRNIQQERADEIAGNLEAADKEREAMEGSRQELEEHLERIEAEERDRIQQATASAHEARDQIIAEARQRGEQIVEESAEAVERQREHALAELRDEVADLAVDTATRALRGRLSEDVHRALVSDFIEELERGEGQA
ncbi:MAG: F0F1 ATP synthase subunit B [Armatimonadota bacterium]|jgi:F-type H+-transporting ATPase subunit b